MLDKSISVCCCGLSFYGITKAPDVLSISENLQKTVFDNGTTGVMIIMMVAAKTVSWKSIYSRNFLR